MTELSHDAQRVLASYHTATAPSPEREVAASSRLREAMITNPSANGAVVTASFRRARQFKLSMRLLRRAVITGVMVFGVIWFLDRGLPEMSSAGMLEDAQENIDQGEYRQAYALLVQHSRAFATKDKAESRMGMVVDSLCGLGLPTRARMELERYVDMVPASRHAERIHAPCEKFEGPEAVEPPEPTLLRGLGFGEGEQSDGVQHNLAPEDMPVDGQFGTAVRTSRDPRLTTPAGR